MTDDRMSIERELDDEEKGRNEAEEGEVDYLQVANASFEASTDYMRTSLTAQWERNLRMWQNRHPQGSKYDSDDYRARSKLFRPKTRSAMRKREAGAAAAFFATADIVAVDPHDDSDEIQLASAEIGKELLNYRLTKTIPWFLLTIGAYQDCNVMGYCVSRQGWLFEERQEGVDLQPVRDPISGMPSIDDTGALKLEERPIMKVVTDRPDVALIPPENVRFDYAASWIDPAQSSPFFIVQWPMYVTDIKARMRAKDSKTGQPQWKVYTDDMIQQARDEEDDSVRRARIKDRQDPVRDKARPLADFDIVFVREVFLRIDGEDKTFWTLGTQGLLTEPNSASAVYWYLNRRPYRIGFSNIETHKATPASIVELGGEIQQHLNEIINQRVDNVRLAMNARYFVRSGRNVDIESLRRGSPGSSTMMTDPDKDVVVHRAPDVTSSAYVEQDRGNVDYDELVGHFSAGTVQTERSLNETVGGMNMLSNAVNSVQDYDLRVFAETWAEPVLRDLLKLEQALEDDETVIGIAGKKAKLWERFGISEVTDEILEQEMHVTVNVGQGSTDPMQRIQKFQLAAQTVGMALGPSIQQMLNAEEIVKEVFGILGYKDGRRFFKFQDGVDPVVQQLQQQVQALQSELENKTAAARMAYDAKIAQIAADKESDAAVLRAEMKAAADNLRMQNNELAATTWAKMQDVQIEWAKLGQAIASERRAAAGQHLDRMASRDSDLHGRSAARAKQISDSANATAERRMKQSSTVPGDQVTKTLADVGNAISQLSNTLGSR